MRKILCIFLIIFCVKPILGQKIKTAFGDISVLAGKKELSVTFGYDNMKVHGYATEAEFIEDKVQIRERHTPGSGEQFRTSWVADRDSVYEPLFIKYINHSLPEKRNITVSRNNPNAEYNLHIQTLWVYPGYNVVISEPCKIDVVLQLYEIANPKNIVWESKSPIRIQAEGASYKREKRIGAAYASLGISMSWLLKKKAK